MFGKSRWCFPPPGIEHVPPSTAPCHPNNRQRPRWAKTEYLSGPDQIDKTKSYRYTQLAHFDIEIWPTY